MSRFSQARPTLTGLIQAAAALCAVFSIATLFDSAHRLLELFSHFRLQYLGGAVVLAILLFALRQVRWGIGLTLVALINAWTVLPYYQHASPETSQGGATLTLLHTNILSSNTAYDELIALIDQTAPDVVLVQEFTAAWQTALADLAGYPNRYELPRDDNFGLALYSRHALSVIEVHNTGPIDLPVLAVTLDHGGNTWTLISPHTMPPLGESGTRIRNAQLADIAEIANSSDMPTVIIGDLNISMWAYHFAQLIADTGYHDARLGNGVLPSWPAQLPFAMIPIDHCLVSDGIEVLDIDTGPNIGSDHLPLIVTLRSLP